MSERPRSQPSADPDVLIIRDFIAPQALVFQAWTYAEHLQRWYAPSGCALTTCALDFRPGGSLRFCIRSPTGHDCWVAGVFTAITAPERIVFTMVNTDAQGQPVPPVTLGMDPEWPGETTVTVTLADLGGGRTRLTLHQTVRESVAKRTGAHPSWLSMFDRLAADLASR